MSARFTRLAWGLLVGACLLGLFLSSGQAQNAKAVKIEELIPAKTVLFGSWDGAAAHQAAFEKTAAHDAFYKSGLVPLIEKLVASIQQQAQAKLGGNEQAQSMALSFDKVAAHLKANGITVAVSLSEGGGNTPTPQALVIVRNAAALQKELTKLEANFKDDGNVRIQERTEAGRKVKSIEIPNTPGIEVGWWVEGKHVVIVAGINAVAEHLAVASGKTPNITKGDLWAKYSKGNEDFETDTIAWLDLGKLQSAYGDWPLPIPTTSGDPLTVAAIAKVLGLDSVGSIISQTGYKGRAAWSETILQAPGEHTGLVAFADAPAISLKDLPPLPATCENFVAVSCEPTKLYDNVIDLMRNAITLYSPRDVAQFDQALDSLPKIAGFDPRDEFLAGFGNVAVLYSDPNQSVFGIGMGAAIQVKDAKQVRKTIDHVLMMATQATRGEFQAARVEKHGRSLIQFDFKGVQAGGFCVDDKWLCIGLVPQSVETMLMRLDGKLPSWKPAPELAEAFKEMPEKFTSLTVSDPRKLYQMLLGLAPVGMTALQAGMRATNAVPEDFRLPVTVADIPPADVVTAPLFPNVSMAIANKDGFKWITRSSVPAVPFVGEMGAGSIGGVAVMTALLLPAVQQARSAAQRSDSKNKLKQLGLAMHNYADTHNELPMGTVENADLEADERLSWLYSVLPYIDQAPLYQKIDKKSAWDSDANKQWTSIVLPVFTNPGSGDTKTATTHYIGIAGVGEDTPGLKKHNNRTGVFGYDRKTRFRDITDGTSNTMCVTESSTPEKNSWAQGGKSTIRALTKKPYINGPDGIGGPFPGGLNVLLTDGSVRFVSQAIDPKLFEGLSTAQGGEVLNEF